MLRATDELKEMIIDDPTIDLSTSQQAPPLTEGRSAERTPEDQATSGFLPADANEIDDETRQEFKEVFELFDDDGSGKIKATKLSTIMRSLGQDPTEAEMQDLMSEAGLTDDGEFTLEGKCTWHT